MSSDMPRLASLCLAIGLTFISSAPTLEGQSAASDALGPGLDPNKPIHQYVHQVWTTDDGLPSNTIRDIVQTEDGYLWLATHAGLVRFDGVRFRTFDTRNTPSLPTHELTQLCLARDGTLWIGSNSGLIRFRDGEFSTWTTSEGLAGGVVQDLLQDPAGSIWVVAGGEVHRLEGETLSVVDRPAGVEEGQITSVEASVDGTLWLTTLHDGVIRKSRDGWHRLSDADGLPIQQIMLAYLDREESIWLAGGGSSPTWLARYHEGSVTDHSDVRPGRGRVRAMLGSRNGALWIAANGGLLRFYRGRFESFVPEGATVDRRFLSLFEDRDGSLWTSTYGGGLQRFSEGPITTYSEPDGLIGDVMSIFEDRQQKLWVGTHIGLHRFENDRFRLEVEVPTGLRAIAEAADDALWLGTNRELVRYAAGELTSFPTSVPVLAVLEDREGRVWTSLAGIGLWLLRESELVPVEELADDSIRWIHEDPEGSLWVGTNQGGLGRLDGGRLTRITVEDGLSSDGVLSHLRDDSGILWIGTRGGGLNRLAGGDIRTYSSRDGLHADSIWPVLEDDRQNLWMGGDRGIFRVRKRDLADFDAGRLPSVPVKAFGVEHGMKSAEGRGAGDPSGFRAHDGRLWFVNVAGAVALDPERANEPLPAPIVMIEEVRVDGEVIDLQEELRFPFGADELQIQFTAPSFLEPERIEFQHRLDTLDSGWRDSGTRRTAFYSQVPPGDYQFRVRVRRQSDSWSAQEAVLPLTVLPLWWQTWWYRIGVVLLIAALIVAGVRVRMRTLTRRNKELEREIQARRAAEESLREVESLGRSTLDALTSPVVVLDDKGTIVKVNRAWKQFGEKNNASSGLIDGVGWNYLDVCRKAAAEGSEAALRVLEGFQGVLAGRAAVFDLEYDCHSSTEKRWFLLRAVPMSGSKTGLVVSHIDVSQSKIAELELRDSELELQRQRGDLAHMQRTAALGELTGALSHEINQPLAAIRTNAQAALRYLSQGMPDLTEIREILTDIASDDRRASEVILRLRSLLKKQPVTLSPIDINCVVGEAVELVRTEAILEQVEVEQDLEQGLDPVLGDEIQLQQVMVNLLLNAFEATSAMEDDGRKVLLRTRPEPDQSVRVSIIDTGPGLGDQSPEEIFSTFHTTKPSGMGIGLSISRTIVESHGGKIWAETDPDGGATFYFTLPTTSGENSQDPG